MNDRLQIHLNLTDKFKTWKVARYPLALILETWSGIWLDEDKLPDYWLRESRKF
jgi:hypothetical protein